MNEQWKDMTKLLKDRADFAVADLNERITQKDMSTFDLEKFNELRKEIREYSVAYPYMTEYIDKLDRLHEQYALVSGQARVMPTNPTATTPVVENKIEVGGNVVIEQTIPPVTGVNITPQNETIVETIAPNGTTPITNAVEIDQYGRVISTDPMELENLILEYERLLNENREQVLTNAEIMQRVREDAKSNPIETKTKLQTKINLIKSQKQIAPQTPTIEPEPLTKEK